MESADHRLTDGVGRRDMLALAAGGGAAWISGLSGFAALTAAAMPGASAAAALAPRTYDPKAWHQRLKRVMQVNFNEKDPENFDAEKYADHLAACRAQATWLSITNVTAFYPSNISGLPRSAFLGERDIFGECVRALRKRNIRILGRLSPDLAKASVSQEHPEWFRRDKEGRLVTGAPPEAGPQEFALTCQFTSYYSDLIPAVMTEVMTRYGIDGIYTNGWPNGGRGLTVPPCYCQTCRAIGEPGTEAYRAAYEKRAIELWQLYDGVVRRANPHAIFTGNLGGGFEAGELDFEGLMKQAPFYFADTQGRYALGDPAWTASQQIRLGKALVDNRPVPLATASYSLGIGGMWRNASGSPEEIRSRLFQTAATGGTVYAHWLGYQQGFVEDRRWQAVTREVLSWQADNDRHFHNVGSLADVAMVISLRSNRVYQAPAGTNKLDSIQGMYRALIDARMPFDLLLDADLSLARIGRYKALILPNLAALSDGQARQIAAYVAQGGSLLSTFETGLYDEAGKKRADFALGRLYGMRKTGDRTSYTDGLFTYPPGASTLQRIERSHPLTASFRDTNWIHGTALRVPIRAQGDPLMTFVPPYPSYPMEAVYPRTLRSDEPTLVAREAGASRLVYLSGEVEGTYWRTGSADLGDLLVNAIRWTGGDDRTLTVDGEGLIEIYGWQTEPGYAVHLLNYTNPEFRSGTLRRSYPVGTQKVRMKLNSAKPLRQASLLRSGKPLPLRQQGNLVEFSIPDLVDYEVAALEY